MRVWSDDREHRRGKSILEGLQVSAAAPIIIALRGHRFRLGDERRLQGEIADCLSRAGILAEREVRLDKENRIDFLAGRVGIEVKIKGAKMAIYRQVERYCGFEEIDELILVTNAAMGLPTEVKGKPVFYHSLGAGWL